MHASMVKPVLLSVHARHMLAVQRREFPHGVIKVIGERSRAFLRRGPEEMQGGGAAWLLGAMLLVADLIEA